MTPDFCPSHDWKSLRAVKLNYIPTRICRFAIYFCAENCIGKRQKGTQSDTVGVMPPSPGVTSECDTQTYKKDHLPCSITLCSVLRGIALSHNRRQMASEAMDTYRAQQAVRRRCRECGRLDEAEVHQCARSTSSGAGHVGVRGRIVQMRHALQCHQIMQEHSKYSVSCVILWEKDAFFFG